MDAVDEGSDCYLRMIPPSISDDANVYRLEMKGEYLVKNGFLKHMGNLGAVVSFHNDIMRLTFYSVNESAFERLGVKIKTKTFKFLEKYRAKKSPAYQKKLRNTVYFVNIDAADIDDTPKICVSMLFDQNSLMNDNLKTAKSALRAQNELDMSTRNIRDPKPFHCVTKKTKSRHLNKIRCVFQ